MMQTGFAEMDSAAMMQTGFAESDSAATMQTALRRVGFRCDDADGLRSDGFS